MDLPQRIDQLATGIALAVPDNQLSVHSAELSVTSGPPAQQLPLYMTQYLNALPQDIRHPCYPPHATIAFTSGHESIESTILRNIYNDSKQQLTTMLSPTFGSSEISRIKHTFKYDELNYHRGGTVHLRGNTQRVLELSREKSNAVVQSLNRYQTALVALANQDKGYLPIQIPSELESQWMQLNIVSMDVHALRLSLIAIDANSTEVQLRIENRLTPETSHVWSLTPDVIALREVILKHQLQGAQAWLRQIAPYEHKGTLATATGRIFFPDQHAFTQSLHEKDVLHDPCHYSANAINFVIGQFIVDGESLRQSALSRERKKQDYLPTEQKSNDIQINGYINQFGVTLGAVTQYLFDNFSIELTQTSAPANATNPEQSLSYLADQIGHFALCRKEIYDAQGNWMTGYPVGIVRETLSEDGQSSTSCLAMDLSTSAPIVFPNMQAALAHYQCSQPELNLAYLPAGENFSSAFIEPLDVFTVLAYQRTFDAAIPYPTAYRYRGLPHNSRFIATLERNWTMQDHLVLHNHRQQSQNPAVLPIRPMIRNEVLSTIEAFNQYCEAKQEKNGIYPPTHNLLTLASDENKLAPVLQEYADQNRLGSGLVNKISSVLCPYVKSILQESQMSFTLGQAIDTNNDFMSRMATENMTSLEKFFHYDSAIAAAPPHERVKYQRQISTFILNSVHAIPSTNSIYWAHYQNFLANSIAKPLSMTSMTKESKSCFSIGINGVLHQNVIDKAMRCDAFFKNLAHGFFVFIEAYYRNRGAPIPNLLVCNPRSCVFLSDAMLEKRKTEYKTITSTITSFSVDIAWGQLFTQIEAARFMARAAIATA